MAHMYVSTPIRPTRRNRNFIDSDDSDDEKYNSTNATNDGVEDTASGGNDVKSSTSVQDSDSTFKKEINASIIKAIRRSLDRCNKKPLGNKENNNNVTQETNRSKPGGETDTDEGLSSSREHSKHSIHEDTSLKVQRLESIDEGATVLGARKKFSRIKNFVESSDSGNTSSDDSDEDYVYSDSGNTSSDGSDEDYVENSPYFGSRIVDDDSEYVDRKSDYSQSSQPQFVDGLKDIHGSLVARPTENERAQDPKGLKVSLMPHQQHALAWIQWRETRKPRGGILADEMGLGKTLTMIALVMASKAKNNAGEGSDNEEDWKSSARSDQQYLGGTLVVAPASLLAQWNGEVKSRCKNGILSVEVHHGPKRESAANRLAKKDIVITTYNILFGQLKKRGILYKIRWRRVILDEAHIIRNHKGLPCNAVCALKANKRWAVTGTPLHNKELDLYSLLKFLQCSPFDDIRVWKGWVNRAAGTGLERLSTVVTALMLRRTKEELRAKGQLPPLPEKNVELFEVALDPEERLVHDKLTLYSQTIFAQFLAQRAEKAHAYEMGGGKHDRLVWMDTYKETKFTRAQTMLLSLHAGIKSSEILVLLLRLRQICCHPSLITAMLDENDINENRMVDADIDIDLSLKMKKMSVNEADAGVDKRVVEDLLTSDNPVFNPNRQSSKMRAVLTKIDEILAEGEKIIIVSQWVGLLNLVADELSAKGLSKSYKKFTGQVGVKYRQGVVDDFNSKRSTTKILLLSLTAGGVGLNLVGGNHLILMDVHWNPQLEAQAQDRIHRFGQDKKVHIYKYVCMDTIEERVLALQEAKLNLADTVLNGGGTIVTSKLSLADMKTLFGC